MTTPTVIRLSSPSDVATSVPMIVGFTPTDSLVVLVLAERRLIMAMRVDLTDAYLVLGHLSKIKGAERVLLVAYGDLETSRQAVSGVQQQCSSVYEVGEALHVAADGAITSFTCEQSCCQGLRVQQNPVTQTLAAASALAGRSSVGTREDLAAALMPGRRVITGSRITADELFDVVLHEGALTDAHLGGLLFAVRENALRDLLVARSAEDATVLARLIEAAPYADEITRKHALATVAIAAYLQGDGALANIALGLGGSSTTLGALVQTCISAAIPPAEVRAGLFDS